MGTCVRLKVSENMAPGQSVSVRKMTQRAIMTSRRPATYSSTQVERAPFNIKESQVFNVPGLLVMLSQISWCYARMKELVRRTSKMLQTAL